MPAYAIDIEHRADDQVFSYYHGDKLLHFNVSLLARLRKQMPAEFKLITYEITDEVYDLCIKHRGIEEPKVAALTGKQLREPGYGVFHEDGSFTMVDGHHRVVRRYRGNVRQMDVWVTYKEVWSLCLVEYPPEFEAILAADIPERMMEPAQISSRVTWKD